MHLETNRTMEKQPFEDVSPINQSDFPASHVPFPGCCCTCHKALRCSAGMEGGHGKSLVQSYWLAIEVGWYFGYKANLLDVFYFDIYIYLDVILLNGGLR